MYYGQQNVGRWIMENSFDEIQSAPVPMDGSQTMFMLTNEPIFYIVSFVNGQKMISGYTFTPLTAENQPKRQMTTEERLSVVEENIAKIAALLEGAKSNESDISKDATATAGTAAKP